MTGRVITSLLAAASVALAVPIEETFYQFLGSDQTTVLCDSRTPGSCDPFVAQMDVFAFGGGSELIVTPTSLSATLDVGIEAFDPTLEYFIRVRHFFEDEIDLGWYAFEGFQGETGDFLAQYSVDEGSILPIGGGLTFSLDPGPFPIGGSGTVEVPATFGRPFRVRAHLRASWNTLLFVGDTFGSRRRAAQHLSSLFMEVAIDPNGPPIPVQVVPAAPIPEPGGLSLLGLGAILAAAVIRKGS